MAEDPIKSQKQGGSFKSCRGSLQKIGVLSLCINKLPAIHKQSMWYCFCIFDEQTSHAHIHAMKSAYPQTKETDDMPLFHTIKKGEKMNKILMAVAVFTIVLLVSEHRAEALTYNIYTDYSSFSAAAGSTMLYDFESDTVGADYKVHDFGDFSVDGSSLYAVTIQDVSTKELFFNTSSYTQDMAVTLDVPSASFGFDWRNTDNNTDMIRVDFDNIQHVLGAKDESGFWGIVATDGMITADMPFLFGDTSGGAGWTTGNLDNFRYGTANVDDPAPVPEPSTFLLLCSGLAGLGCYARKRKKA